MLSQKLLILLPVPSLVVLMMVLHSEAGSILPTSSACDPSSLSFDNTIIFADIDSTDLADKKKLYPNDGYISWMESTRSTYERSVYVPSTANVCQGVGFHWSVSTDTTDSHISIAAAFYLGEAPEQGGSKAGGFGAIGFSETGGMRGADVAYFTFQDSDPTSTAKLTDAHILDSLTKPIPDEQQDWTLVDHTVTNDGYLIFEMTRELDTSDFTDRRFINDSSTFVENHKLIAAWNRSPNGDVIYHGQNRARTSIRLFDSDESGLAPGLDYDGFKTEMEERSDNSVHLGLSYFPIPVYETYYHEDCYSLSDLISKGLFKNADSTANIIGYEFNIDPETVKYMHHIVLYGHYDDGCSSYYRSPIFAWAPGSDFLSFPQSSGFIVGGANRFRALTMQYHVDNKDLDTGKFDKGTGVRIYTTAKETIAVEIGMMQIGDPFVQLGGKKVGDGLTKHEFECPSSCTQNRFNVDEIMVISENLHMHSYGKRITNQVVRNNEVIHEGAIDYWDFDQSGTPQPQQNPFQVRKGDVFRTSCYYDTTNGNNIVFGIGSNDEMCMSFILYYPKQALETCGVDFVVDSSCSTDYLGVTALESAVEFGREFGSANSPGTEVTCQKDHFEVTPSNSASSVKIRIKPTNSTIQVEISADKSAWLGFGVNSEGLMLDSDAVIGSPSLDVAKYRLYAKDPSGVRKLEDSRQTLVESTFNQDSQSSSMIFTMLLNDDGSDDVISIEESTTFIYAVGYTNDLTGHSESGSITLSLNDPCKDDIPSSTNSAKPFKKHLFVHGIAGIIAFGILIPIAILSVRLRKWLDCTTFGKSKTWFVVHSSLMSLSFILVVPIFALAVNIRIKKGSAHFQGSHEIIGVLLLVLITIQLLLGILRPRKKVDIYGHVTDDENMRPKNDAQDISSTRRKQWKRVHTVLGILTLTLGIYQICSGLIKFEILFGHGLF